MSTLIDGWDQTLAITREASERALARAAGAFEAEPDDLLATLSFATELIASHAAELAEQPELAGQLIAEVERLTGLGKVSLGREVLRARQLLELPSETALNVQLTLLRKFAGARAVSLWTKEAGSEPKLLGHSSDADTVRPRTAKVVTALLDERKPPTSPFVGVNFNRWRTVPAALIADGGSRRTELLLDAAVPVLSTILAREEGGAGDQDSQQIFTALERRLARLRYDLHDGPQQDVTLLAMDLALFREQLIPIIAEDPNAHRITGRLDDLAAQLVALDGDLRRLSANVQSPFLHTGSLADALRDITDAFATRTGIVPRLRLSGELTGLTDSQQLTLLALIREALSNIREHSDAKKVEIDVNSDSSGTTAEVRDDGRGFDPEVTLVRAARDGHLGLVGMHERVRMLGGQTQIESKPGGPTVISVSVPRWQPT